MNLYLQKNWMRANSAGNMCELEEHLARGNVDQITLDIMIPERTVWRPMHACANSMLASCRSVALFVAAFVFQADG